MWSLRTRRDLVMLFSWMGLWWSMGPMRVDVAVRTGASHKQKGVTHTQSIESLEINPEYENPPIPEPGEEVIRAQNQEKIKIQLPENRPGATLDKIPARAREAHQEMDKMTPDAAPTGL
jgi:hypothetical protein